MSLQGFAEGKSRQEIKSTAYAMASKYYGTECVTVELSNERATTFMFTAEWNAQESHRWDHSAYGFPKCGRCRTEMPR